MKLSFTTLDVFTSTPYAGNPLAIVHVPSEFKDSLTQSQKQSIAKEFNLSETIFLHLPDPTTTPAPTHRQIDIFTIHAELPFAGHPTIGAAHYFLRILNQQVSTIITKAGEIPIAIDRVTGNVQASIPHDFKQHVVTFKSELNTIDNPICSIVKGMNFILISLPDLATLSEATKNIAPEAGDVSTLDEGWRQGMIGTLYFVAMGEDGSGRKRYRTRMQAWVEDPGTGSASSALACFLALKENKTNGKAEFLFEQGVEMRRRNEIFVEVEKKGDEKGVESVCLSGSAVKVMEGSLDV